MIMQELLSVEEMTDQIKSFQAEMEDIKKDLKEAQDENMEEKIKKEKEADDNTKNDTKNDTKKEMSPKREAAIIKAGEVEDPEKRKMAMKKAMNMKDEEKSAEEEEEEKKEMKAELQSMRVEIAKPKLTYLADIYKNSNITKEKFIELSASWDIMSITQLDDEINKIAPFVNEHSADMTTPLSPSKLEFKGNTKNTKFDEIEKMSGVDLFNKNGGSQYA